MQKIIISLATKVRECLKNRVALWGQVFAFSLITGCVNTRVGSLADLPLPANSNSCCWQALQQLDIRYKNETYKLNAALAFTKQDIILVLLDPFGRRLLSLKKPHHLHDFVETYRAPELPESLPGQFLLASSLLAWLPFEDWETLLAMHANHQWQLGLAQNDRLLSYKGRAIVRLSYTPQAVSLKQGVGAWTVANHEILELQHLHQPLSIIINTQRLDAL